MESAILQNKNGPTPPELDSEQDPHKKHHTLPADVRASASEDSFSRMSAWADYYTLSGISFQRGFLLV